MFCGFSFSRENGRCSLTTPQLFIVELDLRQRLLYALAVGWHVVGVAANAFNQLLHLFLVELDLDQCLLHALALGWHVAATNGDG
jgi:hypothetical protein